MLTDILQETRIFDCRFERLCAAALDMMNGGQWITLFVAFYSIGPISDMLIFSIKEICKFDLIDKYCKTNSMFNYFVTRSRNYLNSLSFNNQSFIIRKMKRSTTSNIQIFIWEEFTRMFTFWKICINIENVLGWLVEPFIHFTPINNAFIAIECRFRSLLLISIHRLYRSNRSLFLKITSSLCNSDNHDKFAIDHKR